MKKSVCFLCSLLLALLISAPSALAYRDGDMVVYSHTANRVHLREEPSADSPSMGLFFVGTLVKAGHFTDETETWVSVQIGEQGGFMKAEYLKPADDFIPEEAKQPIGRVTSSGKLNLREKPDGAGNILARINQGESLIIMGETASHWYYVNYAGTTGYVKAEYVKMSDALSPDYREFVSGIKTADISLEDNVETQILITNCHAEIEPWDGESVRVEFSPATTAVMVTTETSLQQIHAVKNTSSTVQGFVSVKIPGSLCSSLYFDFFNSSVNLENRFTCPVKIESLYSSIILFQHSDDSLRQYGCNISMSQSDLGVYFENMPFHDKIDLQHLHTSTLLLPDFMPEYKEPAESYTAILSDGKYSDDELRTITCILSIDSGLVFDIKR